MQTQRSSPNHVLVTSLRGFRAGLAVLLVIPHVLAGSKAMAHEASTQQVLGLVPQPSVLTAREGSFTLDSAVHLTVDDDSARPEARLLGDLLSAHTGWREEIRLLESGTSPQSGILLRLHG